VLAISCLIPPLFIILLLLRTPNENLNYFERLSQSISQINSERMLPLLKISAESFRSFEDLTNVIQDNFIHPESGVIRIFFMPISRELWPDKPESISRILAKEYSYNQYVAGGGTVATIFGDTFINGHILGVIFLLLMLGYVSKAIYNTMIQNHDISIEQRSILIMAYCMFVFDFLHYFRGFFSEYYWKTIICMASFCVFYAIHKRKSFMIKSKINA
jgi:hypothetical protein